MIKNSIKIIKRYNKVYVHVKKKRINKNKQEAQTRCIKYTSIQWIENCNRMDEVMVYRYIKCTRSCKTNFSDATLKVSDKLFNKYDRWNNHEHIRRRVFLQ